MEGMQPVGFRFRPTDEELVTNYLQKKVQEEPLTNNVIPDCGIYDKEPWELEIVKNNPTENCFYAFTKLKRRGAKETFERGVAGSGTWKNQYTQDVKDGKGEVIGYRTLLSFKAKGATATNDKWTMHQFSLKKNDLSFNDFALCKISRKSTSSGSKDGQVKSKNSKAKRKRNGDERINEVTLQPQVENKDTSFQNSSGLSNPELCGEESQHPKNKQLISSVTEEAPTENNYIEVDPERDFKYFTSSFCRPDHPPIIDTLDASNPASWYKNHASFNYGMQQMSNTLLSEYLINQGTIPGFCEEDHHANTIDTHDASYPASCYENHRSSNDGMQQIDEHCLSWKNLE